MNGVPAILLMVSMAITAIGSLFDGKKRTAMTAIGLTTALAACVAAAKQEAASKKTPAPAEPVPPLTNEPAPPEASLPKEPEAVLPEEAAPAE